MLSRLPFFSFFLPSSGNDFQTERPARPLNRNQNRRAVKQSPLFGRRRYCLQHVRPADRNTSNFGLTGQISPVKRRWTGFAHTVFPTVWENIVVQNYLVVLSRLQRESNPKFHRQLFFFCFFFSSLGLRSWFIIHSPWFFSVQLSAQEIKWRR